MVKLPSGVFKPYAGVSTAILFFTKKLRRHRQRLVLRHDADGFSLDDKRTPLDSSDLDDVFTRWDTYDDGDHSRANRTVIPRSQAEIAENDYDLSLNRYKEIEHEEVDHKEPAEIIADLETLEAEILIALSGVKELMS